LTNAGCKTIFDDEGVSEATTTSDVKASECATPRRFVTCSTGVDEWLAASMPVDRANKRLDIIYVQAKRWAATVGRPEIQKFAGALHGQHATKGIFITTSDFSRDADEYVLKIGSKIVLIDGSKLAELMIEFGVAVATEATYTVKRIDNDFFEVI
jgi:predicted helicase